MEGKRDKEGWRTVYFTDSTPVHLQYGGNRRNDGSYLENGEEAPPQTKNKKSIFVHVYGAVNGRELLGPYYIRRGSASQGSGMSIRFSAR